MVRFKDTMNDLLESSNMCPPGHYMDDFNDCLPCAAICGDQKIQIWMKRNCELLCPDEFARLFPSTTLGSTPTTRTPPVSSSNLNRDIIITAVIIAATVAFAIVMLFVIQCRNYKKKKKVPSRESKKVRTIEEGVNKKIVQEKKGRNRHHSVVSITSEYSILDDTDQFKVVRFKKKNRPGEVIDFSRDEMRSTTLRNEMEAKSLRMNGSSNRGGPQLSIHGRDRSETLPKYQALEPIPSIAGSADPIAGSETANQSNSVLNVAMLRQELATTSRNNSEDRFSSSTTSTQTDFLRDEATITEEHAPVQVSPDGCIENSNFAAFHPNLQNRLPLTVVHSFATRSDQSLLRSSFAEGGLQSDNYDEEETEYEPTEDYRTEGIHISNLSDDLFGDDDDDDMDFLNITPTANMSLMS